MAVPFVDMVTTRLDETSPLTLHEYKQRGTLADKAACDYMPSDSPRDNLAALACLALYPSARLRDAQVQHFEPARYLARLRTRQAEANPVLLDTDLAPSPGGACGRFAVLARRARQCAFLIDLAGLATPAPAAK